MHNVAHRKSLFRMNQRLLFFFLMLVLVSKLVCRAYTDRQHMLLLGSKFIAQGKTFHDQAILAQKSRVHQVAFHK